MLQERVTGVFQLRNLPMQLLVACGSSLLVGVAALRFSPTWVLVGFAGICFLVVTLRRPELGLIAIVAMKSSIVFEDRLPLIPIGIGSLNIPDISLLILLALIIVRPLAEPRFKFVRTPLDLPLLIFFGMIILSTFIAMGRGSVSTIQAFRGIRMVTYFLTFFVVTNLVRRKVQLFLLIEGLIVLASIVAGAMVVQSFVGGSINLFPGRVETLVTGSSMYGGVTRVLPPGQSVVMFGFILLVVLIAIDDAPSLFTVRFLQVGLVGLAVILTFNRNFWVIAGLALTLLVWLLRGQDRQKLLGRGLLALFLGATALGLAFTQMEPQIDRLVQASLARAATLASSDTVGEGSLQYRYVENSYAVPQMVAHPVVGLGLRAAYRPWDPRLDYSHRLPDGRTYIHNGHFWVLLTSGWIGYLALVWLSAAFLLRGFKNWRNIPDAKMRAIMLACVLTYVGIPLAAIVSPIYAQAYWIPVLGILMGAGETILRGLPE